MEADHGLVLEVQAWLEERLERAPQPPGAPLLLDFEVLDLAASRKHPKLVTALLEEPGEPP